MADLPVRRDTSDDEIDIGALISRVWATKGRAFLAMILVAAIFIAFQAAQYLRSDKIVTYSQAFDLTFEGLADGEFPDGSPFMISDIINPAVLNSVYRENNLAASDLSLDDFRRAINIEPYAPDYFLIVERFQRQPTNNLSAAELAEQQQRMRSELNAAASNSVKISLNLPQEAISSTQAQEVLKDIPQAWALRAIEEQGVLELNLPIYSARIFDEERFDSLDYLVGIELLLKNIELIKDNITALKDQPNATNVVDLETGYNLEDLEKAITDVAEYDLRQLINPVKELGLAKDPDFVRLFYSSRMQDLQLQKQLWEQRAKVTQEVLNSYVRGAREGGNAATNSAPSNLTPQLGDDFLDRLLEVSRQGDNLAYRQELTKQILEYENEALNVASEMQSIELTMASLDEAANNEGTVIAQYVEEVQQRLPTVLATLRDYTRVVGRLHEQLGRQAAGSVGQLIQPQGGSFAESAPSAISDSAIKILVALMVLTFFAAVFFSLIADLLRERKNSQPIPSQGSFTKEEQTQQEERKLALRSSNN